MEKLKTFREWLQLKEAAPMTSQEISPEVQGAAQDVMGQMGSNLVPNDPSVGLTDHLKKKPGVVNTFAKKLIGNPVARKAGVGQVNVDMATKLLVGDQSGKTP